MPLNEVARPRLVVCQSLLLEFSAELLVVLDLLSQFRILAIYQPWTILLSREAERLKAPGLRGSTAFDSDRSLRESICGCSTI